MKRRGFGVGKWNGIGGKIEVNETVEQAMVRESQEEILVTPLEYEKIAEIEFSEYHENQQKIIKAHVFFATKWSGQPAETDEMKPQWFKTKDIPYDNMWDDDKYWLPLVDKGSKLVCAFELDKDNRVTGHNIKEITNF